MMAQIEKVDDIMDMMKYNVISTPALVINGEVKSAGKSLTHQELKALIKLPRPLWSAMRNTDLW